jgi:hypothetical protein
MKVPFILFAGTMMMDVMLSGCGPSRNSQVANLSASGWQQTPLTIDGSDSDWIKPLPGYISSEKLSYAISNDGANLYILLSTKDAQQQQKIVQGGMTIWVNPKADKSIGDAVGIGYPLDTRNDHDHNLMEEAQPDRYSHKPARLEDRKEYSLFGFVRDSIGTYTYGDDNPQGVNMRMDYNNTGELIYEASIPLVALFPTHNPSASYAAKSVAVGIFIQGLPPGSEVPREGGGPTVGVGGGVGFGSYGGGGAVGISIGIGTTIGGGGRNKQLSRESDIWQTVQLAAGHRPF